MDNTSRLTGQWLTFGVLLLGILFLAGGLIFLCAATQNGARFPLALVLLAIGGGLAAWAGTRWQRARRLAPKVLDECITDLAAAQDGQITLASIISTLDVPQEIALAALARLQAAGLCREDRQEDKTVYVFPGLQKSKVVRRCAYCGNEYSVRQPMHKCPNCGGNLEIVET